MLLFVLFCLIMTVDQLHCIMTERSSKWWGLSLAIDKLGGKAKIDGKTRRRTARENL